MTSKKSPHIAGTVTRAVFRGDSGFAVIRLNAADGEPFTAVGNLSHLAEGEDVELRGEWIEDPRFGRQLRVESATRRPPSTRDGVIRYLSSRLVKGIGPKIATAIVDRFGEKTLKILEQQPGRLIEVPDIGAKRLDKILDSLRESRDLGRIMVRVADHGLGEDVARRIHQTFGTASDSVLDSDPYRLVEEVKGIGFKIADRIAAKLGLDPESDERLRAALGYVLEEGVKQGHMYLPFESLREAVQGLLSLEVGTARMGGILDDLVARDRVYVEDDRVFPSDLNRIENRVAERIVELLAAVPRLKPRDVTGLEAIELRLGITFHPLQIECLKGLAQANVLVLTGGPGTGKTTVLRGLIEVIEARALDYVLAAPTGRAAKRVTESTGRPSRTIHRLLGFTPGTRRFEHGRHNPLPCDAVIVDEVSMVDVRLMSRLLDAIRPGTLLVLVGDRDQLPSIGPGAVLQDLISSEAVPVFRLKHVFRQEGGSLIVSNAHRIREGRGLILPSDPESAGTTEDFYVLFREDPVQIARTTVDLVVERLPRSMGFDPIRDIQVLVPMYRGPAGIDQLNEDLSAALNPHGRVVSQRTSPLKIGDKVIQSTNDYEKEIYNGDIGTILEMDSRSGKVIVEFEGRPVAFTVAQLPSLSLAYAISVHKSQGSEYPCVVLPLHTQHFLLLKRNLLYTAVSRARKLLVVVGSSRALEIAIHEVGDATRFTRLAERLRQKQRS